jgi:hypothetical protein
MRIVRRASRYLRSPHGFDAAAFALGPLIGIVVALAAGQETSWDFRNYHWYNAYSLFTWRYDQDVAVAYHGELFVLYDSGEEARMRTALAGAGLATLSDTCRTITNNLLGIYKWCGVRRTP